MKRILFVDDEPRVLKQVCEILAPQEGQWEMEFAQGGEHALKLLEAASFDVIVSDIKMPGMDGAALLNAVCQTHPGIVRIVLSSQNELEGALRAVPVAHQFLVKPCDLNTLRVAIERATSLSGLLSSKLLASIVGSVRDLPVLPRTYLALRQALANPETSIKQIVRIVEQDVAVSAKILQIVNSSFFGLPREISTVRTAVSFLGIDMVQNLVLSAEVFRVFEQAAAIPGFSFEELHAHSQLVAKIAAQIPASSHVRGVAIVAGLLHDVGKLVLATRSRNHFVRAISGAREEARPLFSVEEELIGVSHAEIGAHLLGIWGLPSPIVEAVAHHHHPERVPQEALDAIAIVHIANFLAHEYPVHPTSADSPPHQVIALEFVETLGVVSQFAEWEDAAEGAAEEMRSGEAAPR